MIPRYLLVRALAVPLAGALLFGLDRLILGQIGASVTGRGGLVLLAGYVLLALALALAGGLPALAWRLLRSRERRAFAWIPGVIMGLLAAPGLYLASADLVRGDWIAKQAIAPAIRYGFIAAGVVGLAALGRLHWGQESIQGRKRLILPLLLTAAALLLTEANLRILPGLYLLLHLAMALVTALLLVLSAVRVLDTVVPDKPSRALGGAGIAAAALAVGAIVVTVTLGRASASTLLLSSPVAAQILPVLLPARGNTVEEELASMDVRAAAQSDSSPEGAEAAKKLLAGKHDWNVLFVIVDTLRADTLPPARRPGQAHAEEGDTPYLDSFIARSYRFRAAYSQASRTRRSVPPTFRSIEAHEDTERIGVALGEQISRVGMEPIAIVPQFFFQPHAENAQALLVGFDHAAVYEKDKAEEQLMPIVRDTLDSAKGQRFFGWLHFYNMHDPYAGRPLGNSDGSPAERYRMSLKWLDGQMKRLDEILKETGLAEKTVIVFTADHGENVGGPDGRVGHGMTVRDSEVRVPLAFHVPGLPGGELDHVVGNIDILPTLFDLLGLPPSPDHRGRSLVPLFAGAGPKEDPPYYFENSGGDQVGVVLDRHKLIHVKKGRFFHHFNVETDPREVMDVYNPTSPIDRRLLQALLRKNPNLFASEIAEPKVGKLLVQKLREIDAKTPANRELDLLLSLTALSKNKEALAEGERIFQQAKDRDVELLVARRLYKADAAKWTKLVTRRVEKAFGTPDEVPLVVGLARQGQPDLEHAVFGKRLAALADSAPPKDWLPILTLVAPWRKPPGPYVGPVKQMLHLLKSAPPDAQNDQVLAAILEIVSSITLPRAAAENEDLFELVRPAMANPDPAVAVRAIRFLAKMGDQGSGPTMEALLDTKERDVRIYNALLVAIADVEGSSAVKVILAHADRPLLTVEACRQLGKIGNPEAVPWLRNIQKTHYNPFTRDNARIAADKIEKAAAQAPKAP